MVGEGNLMWQVGRNRKGWCLWVGIGSLLLVKKGGKGGAWCLVLGLYIVLFSFSIHSWKHLNRNTHSTLQSHQPYHRQSQSNN